MMNKDFALFVFNLPQNGIHVPDLFWNLSGDLIGPNGLFKRSFAIAKVISEKDQREANKEPETQER